jgi:DNA-3-methyladenine glycosylase
MANRMRKLSRSFYDGHANEVALNLLGKLLIHVVEGESRVGKIVEVEAYLGTQDKAAHSAKGKTARTAAMFGPPGHVYVYFTYGLHWCMNVVTGPGEFPSAVLIRAVEPIKNIDGKTNGPALVCRAMGIDRKQYGADLLGEELFLAEPDDPQRFNIVKRPRIGVDYSGRWAKRLLRFYIKGNTYISRK